MKHLLQHFKTLTKHPQNAEELKGLILKLAVNGSLSSSNVQYKRIDLEGLGKWAIGCGFPKVEQGKINQEILFSKVSDMNLLGNEKYILTTNNSISNETALKIRAKIHPKGTVIFPKIGGAIATNKRRILQYPTSIDNNCLGIIPNSNVTTDWLFIVLSSIDFMEYQSGTSVPALSQKIIGKIDVTLPPLEEQKALVAIVNELFKEVEQLEELTKTRIQLKEEFITSTLKRLSETGNVNQEWQFLQSHFTEFFTEKENVKQLRDAILQLAVQGKLSTKWRSHNPNTEPASELLKGINAEKQALIARKKIRKEKPLPPIEDKEKPYDLPEDWVWCRMQEVGIFERGKSKHRPRNDSRLFNNGKYPLVQTGDVSSSKDTGGIITTNRSLYNEFGLAQSRKWNKGTLCITIAANIAETGFLGFDACFPDSVVGFTDLINQNDSLSKYVDFFITVTKSDLEKYAPSTAQKNINLGILYQLIFPLPPLEEQKAIVKQVNRLMALCDSLEEHIEHSQTQIEQLMQSCLREVFEERKEVNHG